MGQEHGSGYSELVDRPLSVPQLGHPTCLPRAWVESTRGERMLPSPPPDPERALGWGQARRHCALAQGGVPSGECNLPVAPDARTRPPRACGMSSPAVPFPLATLCRLCRAPSFQKKNKAHGRLLRKKEVDISVS